MAGKTEWEDILIKKGIIAPPPEVPTDDQLALEAMEAREAHDDMEDKTLDELDELEDDMDEDILEMYREKRMEEMRALASKAKYGRVFQISEPEFVPEVSKAEEGTFVVLHLYANGKLECKLLDKCMAELAPKFKQVKFCRILSTQCIHNYPDANCPTLLIYRNGDIVRNIVGLDTFGGLKMNSDTLEWVLAKTKVLDTEQEDDPRENLRMNMRR